MPASCSWAVARDVGAQEHDPAVERARRRGKTLFAKHGERRLLREHAAEPHDGDGDDQ